MIDEVFRQAFTDVLYEKAKDVLCPACSKLLHGEALDRYKMRMAKRREEISNLQVKSRQEKEVENRRRDLDKRKTIHQKEIPMKNENTSKTPEFLKGSTVDEKGLPLRMKIDGERRLDQPYNSSKKFKLAWNRFEGVVIVPDED